MNTGTKNNLITYLLFLGIASVGIVYGNAILTEHTFLRVWNSANVLLLFIGIPFLFLQSRAGLPDFWQNDVTNRSRIVLPMVIGIIFGILDVLVIKVILHPEPYTELPPFLQPFPYSLFLYFSGALEVEVFYRLIPMTLILLFGNWFKNGRYFAYFFWIGAVLTSLREPIEQLPDGHYLLMAYSLLTGFGMNFLQALWYKKSGFLASMAIRLGHYLVWHILLGIFVEFIELA